MSRSRHSNNETKAGSERQADGGTRRRSPLLFALLKPSTCANQRTAHNTLVDLQLLQPDAKFHRQVGIVLCRLQAPTSRCNTRRVT